MLVGCRLMHKHVFAPLHCFTIILVPVDKTQVNEQQAEEYVTLNQKRATRVNKFKMADGDMNIAKVHRSGQSRGPEGPVKYQFLIKELGNDSALS